MSRFAVLIFVFTTFSSLTGSWAAESSAQHTFKNIEILKSSLGFTKYYNLPNQSKALKIAVLDKGFSGLEKELSSLPPQTQYIVGPVTPPADFNSEHGLRMAQIMTALLTDSLKATERLPELYLYNVFGFTNFKFAIDDLIAKKVDIVLYSEVWEYGGNFDGSGFINEQVNRATSQGILWVNAAGNFDLTTYNTNIKTIEDNWVALPNQNNSLTLKCLAKESCQIKAVLSWNDFKNDVNLGTAKDLDFALTDDLLNIVQTSSLIQSTDPNENRPGYSKYPREIIIAKLKPGTYFLRVKNRSLNFTDKDLLRITVDGDFVEMPSHTVGESLLNPADNPSVITVGAWDSNRSSVSFKTNKPDLFTTSSIIFEDGREYRGSSNSAAIVAAALALQKQQNPNHTKEQLLTKITRLFSWDHGFLSLNQLAFTYTGYGCFVEADPNFNLPDYVKAGLSAGGVLVQTTQAYRIMLPFDPLELAPHLRRNFINDMVVMTQDGGIQVYPRYGYVPPGSVELFQRPIEAGLCHAPSTRNGRRLAL